MNVIFALLIFFMVYTCFLIYQNCMMNNIATMNTDFEECDLNNNSNDPDSFTNYPERRERIEGEAVNKEQEDKKKEEEQKKKIKTYKEIETTIETIRRPFPIYDESDANSRISEYSTNLGQKDRKSQIGNNKKNKLETIKLLHNPILNHYDKMNWYERDTENDFDMFLK